MRSVLHLTFFLSIVTIIVATHITDELIDTNTNDVNVGHHVIEPFVEGIAEEFDDISKEQVQLNTRSPCGWANSARACSSGCWLLDWQKYTYWLNTGRCCCSSDII